MPVLIGDWSLKTDAYVNTRTERRNWTELNWQINEFGSVQLRRCVSARLKNLRLSWNSYLVVEVGAEFVRGESVRAFTMSRDAELVAFSGWHRLRHQPILVGHIVRWCQRLHRTILHAGPTYSLLIVGPVLPCASEIQPPPPLLLFSPLFLLSPLPFGLRSFPASLHGPIRPFSFPFLFTPLPYALSPFPSTFRSPTFVPSFSLSRGALHPARGSSQPSSVSSPADPGRARSTNGLWTAFWGQNSYSGDSN